MSIYTENVFLSICYTTFSFDLSLDLSLIYAVFKHMCMFVKEKYLDLLLSSKKVIPVGDKDPTLVIPFRSGGTNSWGFLNVFKKLKSLCV